MASPRELPVVSLKSLPGNVREFELAVSQLQYIASDEWLSFFKYNLRTYKANIQIVARQLESIPNKLHSEDKFKEHRIPVIAVTDLLKAASTEVKAWEDVIAVILKLHQLRKEKAPLMQKLSRKDELHRQKKADAENRPIAVSGTTEYDQRSQRFVTSMKKYGKAVDHCVTERETLFSKAYHAMETAKSAAESITEAPDVGMRSPMSPSTKAVPASLPAPTAITTGSLPTSITITTAQIKVSDIPPAVKASNSDIQDDKSLDVAAVAPTSMTAIVKVDETLSGMTLCAQQKQYRNVKRVEPQMFSLGDIGWFPVLRPTLFASSSDIHTEFGYICAKSYPVIVVEKLDDCMIGLIISTSGGSGLSRKGPSIKSRSVPIVHESYSSPTSSEWGTSLYPRQEIRVVKSGEYSPPPGAYVDMLNTITIPYDSRYKKEGSIVAADALPLQKMRLSAFLATTGAGRSGSYVEFRSWLDKWGSQFGIAPGLKEMVEKAKAEGWEQGMAQALAIAKTHLGPGPQAEMDDKVQGDVKEREEARAQVIARTQAKYQPQVMAKKQELAGASHHQNELDRSTNFGLDIRPAWFDDELWEMTVALKKKFYQDRKSLDTLSAEMFERKEKLQELENEMREYFGKIEKQGN